MKKLFTAILLITAVLLANVASAGYCDEYKAKHPKNVKTTTSQLRSGKMYTTTDYFLFKSKRGGLSLTINDIDGIKICTVGYSYAGNSWHFYDGFSWGDGETAHDEKAVIKNRDAFRGGVAEVIMAHFRPSDLKNAIVIHAHSERYGDEVIMNKDNKRWAEWQEAVDAAVKIMNDK